MKLLRHSMTREYESEKWYKASAIANKESKMGHFIIRILIEIKIANKIMSSFMFLAANCMFLLVFF